METPVMPDALFNETVDALYDQKEVNIEKLKKLVTENDYGLYVESYDFVDQAIQDKLVEVVKLFIINGVYPDKMMLKKAEECGSKECLEYLLEILR